MKSDRFSINWNDLIKGLYMAVILPVLTVVQQSISHEELTFNWRLIGLTALGGLVGYLIKNFFTDNVKDAEKTIEIAEKKASS